MSLKRLLEYFAIAVAAFAAFALLVRTVDANKYKPQLSQMLYAVLGREVRLNGPVDFSAGFDGIRISARDVAVVNKGPASRPLLAGIGRVELGMDTLCLFKGYLPIKELSIENADILFETNAEGKSNWILGEAEGVSREREFLSVDLLKIVNSRIVRLKAGGAHTNAEIETLTLKMDGSSVNLNAKGRLNRAPFIADIRTNKKDLFGRDPFSIDAAGIYDGLNFAAIGTVDLAGGRAEFQAYEAAVGETRFGGALDATWRSGRLILHGNVASKRFNPANFKVRIVNEAGQRPVVEPGVDPNALIFSANPLPLDKLRAADVDLAISIDELPLGLNVLTGIEARLILSRGYLTLAPVKAYLGRAPVELRMVLDATAPVARFDFGLIADGVELGDVQNLWGMKAFLTGNGGVYVRLAGKGNSAHEIASNLIGIVNVGAMKGNISAGLLSNVSSILLSRFLSGGGESNVLNCLAARFIVRNGIMADNGILIDSAASTISGQGAINLSNEAVQMALRARTKVVSLNNLIPLIQIGGSLKDLRYSVDAANVVKGVVGAFVSDVDEASWPIPEVQPDPSGGNPCIYTLDHPQKRYSPEGLRSDKLGRAGQIIEELGKSLIGGLFNK